MSKKISKKLKKAFTLVELVIVIAIIAILTSVSIVTYFGVTSSAKKSVLTEEATSLKKELQAVSASAGTGDYEKLSWSKVNGFTFSTSSETKDVDRLKDLLKEDGLKGTMEEYSNNKDNSIKEIIYSSTNYNQIAIIDTTNWNINYENKPGQGEAIPAQLKNIKDYENGTKIKSRGYFMGGANGNIAYASSGTNNFRLTGINSSDIASFIPEQTIIEFEGDLNINKGSDYVDYAYPSYIIKVEKYSSVTKKDNLETPVVYNLNKDSIVELKEDLINAKVNVTDAIVKSYNSPSKKNRSIKSAKVNECFQFSIANSDVDYYLYTKGDTDNQEFLGSLKIGDRFSFSAFVTIYKQFFEFQHITHIEKFSLPSTSVAIKSSKDIATIGETIDLNYDIAPVNSTDKVEFKFANNIASDIATINGNKLTILKKPGNGTLEITATITDINGNENTNSSITNKIITVKEEVSTNDKVTFDYTQNHNNNKNLEISKVNVLLSKGTGTSEPSYQSRYNETRVYSGNTITISHPTLNISKVEFDYGVDNSSNYLTYNGEKILNNSITGNNEKFVFTVIGSSGHVKLRSITVTLCERPVKQIESINISVDNNTLLINDKTPLNIEILPANYQGTITPTIESSTNSIEIIEENEIKYVHALFLGTATIKYTSDNNITSNEITINVIEVTPADVDLIAFDFINVKGGTSKNGITFNGDTKNLTSITSNYFDITFDKNSGNNPGFISNSDNALRFYVNNSITITNKTNKQIQRLEIEFLANTNSNFKNITCTNGKLSTNSKNNVAIYSNSFDELQLKITQKQFHIKAIKIYYNFDVKTISISDSTNGSITSIIDSAGNIIENGASVSSDETLTISVSPNENYITEKVMANNKDLQINADEKYDLVLKDFEESTITISATFTIDTNKEFNLSWKIDIPEDYYTLYFLNSEGKELSNNCKVKYGSEIKIMFEINKDKLDAGYKLISIISNNNTEIKDEGDGFYSFTLTSDTEISFNIEAPKPNPKSIEIYKSSDNTLVEETLEIEVGTSIELLAIVKPDGADQSVIWKSDNSDIVSVDNGILTANKLNDTTKDIYIYITSTIKSEAYTLFEVKVIEKKEIETLQLKYTFEKSKTSSNDILSSDTLSNLMTQPEEYKDLVSFNPVLISTKYSKVYADDGKLKLGAKNTPGQIQITLNNNIYCINKVSIECVNYKDDSFKLVINKNTFELSETNNIAIYENTNKSTAPITVSSVNRIYIKSITITIEKI
jgi:prepilin-type cleavage/methylation N-terminal domain protein